MGRAVEVFPNRQNSRPPKLSCLLSSPKCDFGLFPDPFQALNIGLLNPFSDLFPGFKNSRAVWLFHAFPGHQASKIGLFRSFQASFQALKQFVGFFQTASFCLPFPDIHSKPQKLAFCRRLCFSFFWVLWSFLDELYHFA